MRRVVHIDSTDKEFRILCYNDLHSKEKDPTTYSGYVNANRKQLNKLTKLNREYNIDMNLNGGDAYDGGYSSFGLEKQHSLHWTKLRKSVPYWFHLIGNHILIDVTTNPEMYAIQPHPIYKSAIPIDVTVPIFETVEEIIINETIQISMFHYSKYDKDYTSPKYSDKIKNRIAYYHDSIMIPSNVKKQLSIHDNTVNSSYHEKIFRGINTAILADLHVPVPSFRIGTTQVIIPGSPMITSLNQLYRVPSIDLPYIKVLNDTVSISSIRISTELQYYTFPSRSKEEIFIQKMERVRKADKKLANKTLSKTIESIDTITLREYLYSVKGKRDITIERVMSIVQQASTNPIIEELVENIRRGI